VTKPNRRQLTRIGITTGVVHSIFWSTLIYSAEILGVVTFDEPVLRVILIGSFLWGMFGVATVIRRERENIRIEFIDKIAEHYLGIDAETKNLFSGVFNYCWFPFSEVGNLDKVNHKW